MSISGCHGSDVVLRVAVPFPLILRVLRELDYNDPRQRQVAEALMDTLPYVLLHRVEVAQAVGDDLA